MSGNRQKGRTPEQIRASNKRLGLILLGVAAAFFVGIFIRQVFFA
ncbi:cytochrome oxidase small assembly protein [Paraburkholderia acidicola]|uniref:Cytochrome oxidase small assembly protein n=1 Tax=Paraburkholderia acidicola TaxID=1912599 RepID=A0ABV1LQ16_9BURK